MDDFDHAQFETMVWDALKEYKREAADLAKASEEFGKFIMEAQDAISIVKRGDEIIKEFAVDPAPDGVDVSSSELDMIWLTALAMKMAAFFVINNRELISMNYWAHMNFLLQGRAQGMGAKDLASMLPPNEKREDEPIQ